jgi:ABC-type maltose transport system permease subunit
LRLRVLEHESIVRPVLSRETILIVEVPEIILLVLTLHLLYLSPQISDLIHIFVLLADSNLVSARAGLTLIYLAIIS